MDYEELLDKARKEMPSAVFEKERFELPKVVGHIQGNRTVIGNFYQIADILRRDAAHLVKYILKELATPGELTKTALIIGTKISASRINEKIRQYAYEYVLCGECGKPDTQIIKEGNVPFLKCTACGAKHALKGRV
ncbi:translation initiation factor IF-2 subunit beta [Candidatus Woesearchaeota archaeon]|nr:translation initiation factor IF-2 subunit beta [Candidatus Woesearchaeota archaeon]